MKQRNVLICTLFCSLIAVYQPAAIAQTKAASKTATHPDLGGLWQAITTADWDIQPHSPAPGRIVALGAEDAVPPGTGIVEGGAIPYLPEALDKKKQNYAERLMADPELKCYLPGVPRINYMPFPFQILQSQSEILVAYEYAGAVRTINMQKPTEPPADSWMGWSNGHWEGSTLVVDVIGQNDQTWLDRAGDYHSDELHVTERYTLVNPNLIQYEATLTDPKVYAHPWKISFPLYRIMDKNAQLLEFKCPEFAEDLIYGAVSKKK